MGFTIDEPKSNGITALGIAAYRGNLTILEMLLQAGADQKYLNQAGIGAMFLALKGDKLESVQYLLQKHVPIWHADPQYRDNSPIFFAVRRNRTQALGLFLDKYKTFD
jgi:ankyrin repeat protein